MFSTPSAQRLVLKKWWNGLDRPVLYSSLILILIVMMLSLAAGPAAAARIGFEDPYHFVVRHAAFALAAVAVLLIASMTSPAWVRRLSFVLFLLAFSLTATTLFAGHEAKGAQRWIRLFGQTFQPSEILKPTLIILVAWLLAQRVRFSEAPWSTIAFCLTASCIALLVLQPDIGQALLTAVTFFTVFMVSGMPVVWLCLLAVAGAGLILGAYLVFPHVRLRIHTFLEPGAADTYQIDRAREAIARGGVLGAGPGESEVIKSLPDAHTDFIYAVAAEEFGLVACLVIIALFAFLAVRGVLNAGRVRDPYMRASAVGLYVLFGLQAAINISVNLNLVPPKGMTLPLISSGGSSLIGSALTLGFALALTRFAPESDSARKVR